MMILRAAVLWMLAWTMATAVYGQERREPNMGDDLYTVAQSILDECKATQAKDGRPLLQVVCLTSGANDALHHGTTDALIESGARSFFLRGGFRLPPKTVDDSAVQRALKSTAPEAAEQLAKARSADIMVSVVAMPAKGSAFSVTVEMRDTRDSSAIYEKTFPPQDIAGDENARGRLVASVARECMKAYIEHVKEKQGNRGAIFDVRIVGLDDAVQAEAVGKDLVNATVTRATATFERGDTPIARLIIETTLNRQQLKDWVRDVLANRHIGNELVAENGDQITFIAGLEVALPQTLLEQVEKRYLNDGLPEIQVLIGAGGPARAQVPQGLVEGLQNSIVKELTRCQPIIHRDEVAHDLAQQDIINNLVNQGEHDLAHAIRAKLGEQGLAIIAAYEPFAAGNNANMEAPGRLCVSLVDLRRGGRVIAKEPEDWPKDFGFEQRQIDRRARRLMFKVLTAYCRPPAAEVMAVRIVGLEQNDTRADDIRLALQGVQGVQGPVKMTLPMAAAANAETITLYRFQYAGAAPDLREELRRLMKWPFGTPCRFFEGGDGMVELRIGSALATAPWVAVVQNPPMPDDEFVQQLKSVLKAMGQPRFAVIVPQDKKVNVPVGERAAGWTLLELRPLIQEHLTRVLTQHRCQVVDAGEAGRLLDAVAAQHVQFNSTTAAAVAMQSINVADIVLVLRPNGEAGAIAELIDVSNARLFGAVQFPSAEMVANKRENLRPENPEHVSRYVAGSALAMLTRQAGIPNLMEIIVKDAKAAADIDTIADGLVAKVPGVVGATQRSFAYGVGRFMLSYNGPFHGLHGDLSRQFAKLPWPVKEEVGGAGSLVLRIEGGPAFIPQPPPAVPAPAAPAPVPAPAPVAPAPVPPAPAAQVELVANAAPGWATPANNAPAAEAPLVGNNYAILVGVDQFESAPSLRGSKDAIKLSMTLKQYCGYKDEHVTLMIGGLNDNERAPTARNIVNALIKVAKEATPDDSILVLFSTHGIVDKKTGESFIVPCDESKGLLSAASVRKVLSESRARTSILILDACQSGGRAGAVQGMGEVAGNITGAGLFTMAGCGTNEFSLETPQMGGVFTYFLCEGLRGAADQWAKGNKNHEVELHELYLYTHDKVSDFVSNTKLPPEYKPGSQHPIMLMAEQGEVVLSRFKK